MKEALFLFSFFICLLIAKNSKGQSFTTETDTARTAIYDFQDVYNKITNTTVNPIQITWKVIAHDFPVSWALDSVLGICDNASCRSNINNQLFTNTYTSMDYLPSATGDFHMQLTHFNYPHIVSGQHYMVVNMKNGSNEKNVVFVVTKFPTGISTINKSEDKVSLFPNPAIDVLNIVLNYQSHGKNAVQIYNSTGAIVNNISFEGPFTKIDINNLQPGLYFTRVINSTGDIISVKIFNKI